MPRKSFTPRRFMRRIRYGLLRATGQTREADIMEVRLLEGWLSKGCCRLLYDGVMNLDVEGDVAEIGSWKGKSTVCLGRAIQRSGQARTVFAIDHFKGSDEHEETMKSETDGSTWDDFQQTIRDAKVEAVVTPIAMLSSDAVAVLKEKQARLAFVFVDGGHSEEDTYANIEEMLPFMVPRGYMAFHDAKPTGPFPGVFRAIERGLGERADEVSWGGSIRLMRLRG